MAHDLGIAQCAAADSLEGALAKMPPREEGTVFIGGSLYLAGQVLRANREYPR